MKIPKHIRLALVVAIFSSLLSLSIDAIHVESYQYTAKVYETAAKKEGNTTTYYDHSTEKRTQEEVKQKHLDSIIQNDYTKVCPYKVEPVYTAPYAEGELTDAVIADTLTQINYYRWLAGVTPVTVNYDKMHRNQKGALIQAVNGVLTHWPTQPAGMSDEFFEFASAGTGAGNDRDTGENYTGNVSYGTFETMPGSISGYVDDINNVNAGVGHRSSILDPMAIRTSFGFAGQGGYNGYDNLLGFYTAVSMYRNFSTDPGNHEDFYAYPNAGYFPIEATASRDGDKWLSWSVKLRTGITKGENTTIELTHNDKTYTVATDAILEATGHNTISYKLPTELATVITGENGRYLPDNTVTVQVKNLKDTAGNPVHLSYHTTFFAANPKPVETVQLRLYISDKPGYYYSYSPSETVWLYEPSPTFEIAYTPDDALILGTTLSIADPSIATVDNTAKTITVLKPGRTTLTIEEQYSGKQFNYTLDTNYVKPEITFNRTEITLKVGETFELTRTINPDTFTPSNETYEASNDNISIESNVIKALKEGTATISYQATFLGGKVTKTIQVNVVGNGSETMLKGDLNGNNSIDLTDILLELKIYFGGITPTENQKVVGDMNGDSKIDLTDVLMLLKEYFKTV